MAADEAVDTPARGASGLLTLLAADALENGVHKAVRRAIKTMRRAVDTLEDVKDDGVHYVRRQPLKTLGIAAAVGLIAGLTAGWIAARSRATTAPERSAAR